MLKEIRGHLLSKIKEEKIYVVISTNVFQNCLKTRLTVLQDFIVRIYIFLLRGITMCVLQGHHKVKSYHVICDLLFSSQRTVEHIASGEVARICQ